MKATVVWVLRCVDWQQIANGLEVLIARII
jgi:hypothetical protein